MQSIARGVAVNLQEDRPGMVAKAIEAVAKAGINIEGFAEVGGVLHILAKDATVVRRAIESAGFQAREHEVLVVDAENRPGVVVAIYRRIAAANVNVTFTYVAANNRIVIGADDVAKAAEALAKTDRPATRR